MAEATISMRQLRMLHAQFRGINRADRLQRISLIVARRITTTLDLTAGEASLVIDRMDRESQVPVW